MAVSAIFWTRWSWATRMPCRSVIRPLARSPLPPQSRPRQRHANEKCLGPMARFVAIAIDRGDQLLKGHAALSGDRLQTVPERVFKADARLVACNDNRELRNRKFHGFASLIWCFARQQTNPRQTTTRQQRRRKAQSRKFRSACHVRGLLSTATAQSA